MNWIKGSDKTPTDSIYRHCKIGGFPYILKWSGHDQAFKNMVGECYLKDIVTWLDESEPSFSIENMKKCWNESRIKFPDGSFSEDFETFMYNEYNIDLTK